LGVDTNSWFSIALGILRLIRDPQLLETLDQEIASRDLRTWDQYAADLLGDLNVISYL